MRVFSDVHEWREFRNLSRFEGKSLGFVPTMGALHEGHLALLRRSRAENDLTVASLFVNPTQFDDPEDFRKYPQTLNEDLVLLQQMGADFAIVPPAPQMYPDGYKYQVSENDLSRALCGAHRPGHFQGVLTVVLKLLNLARATRAYFGEKDYQQYLLVKGMADAFFLSTQIISCPTVREADGLAMSSRNRRLGESERLRAPLFPKTLQSALNDEEAAAKLKENGFDVDYVLTRDARRFGAVRLGAVRLIDNVPAP